MQGRDVSGGGLCIPTREDGDRALVSSLREGLHAQRSPEERLAREALFVLRGRGRKILSRGHRTKQETQEKRQNSEGLHGWQSIPTAASRLAQNCGRVPLATLRLCLSNRVVALFFNSP